MTIEDDERRRACVHEAGHAVAAVMRSGSDGLRGHKPIVREDHSGYTHIRIQAIDEWFVTYAGCWAEAYYDFQGSSNEDEDLVFEDFLAGVFLGQPEDLETLKKPLPYPKPPNSAENRGLLWWEGPTEQVWRLELEHVWTVILAVADTYRDGLLHVTGDDIERWLDTFRVTA